MAVEMVLDPFTTLCKMALLDFYPEGTKLSVEENQVRFSRPNKTDTAWRSIRSMFSSTGTHSRDVLWTLEKPLIRAILWYKELAPNILEHATYGVERLLDLYKKGRGCNATIVLKYYLRIMTDFRESPNLLDIPSDADRSELLANLRDQWSDEEIRCADGWVKELESESAREPKIKKVEDFFIAQAAPAAEHHV